MQAVGTQGGNVCGMTLSQQGREVVVDPERQARAAAGTDRQRHGLGGGFFGAIMTAVEAEDEAATDGFDGQRAFRRAREVEFAALGVVEEQGRRGEELRTVGRLGRLGGVAHAELHHRAAEIGDAEGLFDIGGNPGEDRVWSDEQVGVAMGEREQVVDFVVGGEGVRNENNGTPADEPEGRANGRGSCREEFGDLLVKG